MVLQLLIDHADQELSLPSDNPLVLLQIESVVVDLDRGLRLRGRPRGAQDQRYAVGDDGNSTKYSLSRSMNSSATSFNCGLKPLDSAATRTLFPIRWASRIKGR